MGNGQNPAGSAIRRGSRARRLGLLSVISEAVRLLALKAAAIHVLDHLFPGIGSLVALLRRPGGVVRRSRLHAERQPDQMPISEFADRHAVRGQVAGQGVEGLRLLAFGIVEIVQQAKNDLGVAGLAGLLDEEPRFLRLIVQFAAVVLAAADPVA